MRALLDLLGNQDPLEIAASQLPWLERRTAGLDDATLRRPEAPGKWSATEVIQHLADTEVVYAWRTRQILTVDRPEIQGYDQDAWARTLGYAAMPLEVALGQLYQHDHQVAQPRFHLDALGAQGGRGATARGHGQGDRDPAPAARQ